MMLTCMMSLKSMMPGLMICLLSVFGEGLGAQVILFGEAWKPNLCFFGRGLEDQELFCTGLWPRNLVRVHFDRFFLIMHA